MKQYVDPLDDLRSLYEMRKVPIRSRLQEFSNVPPSAYFYELVYCLLTPQSSAVNADKAVQSLRSVQFQERGGDPESFLRNPTHYIRFHKTKSRHLLLARESFQTIARAITDATESSELRDWLVMNVLGLGYKEATHFLRNIGKNGGLAILDRHILRNLKRHNVIRTIPESLSKKKYLTIEKQFMKFSVRIGIPLDELDLLFWSMETGEIRK
ncbi:MAG: DNA lyase [Bacteroidota bacterium]